MELPGSADGEGESMKTSRQSGALVTSVALLATICGCAQGMDELQTDGAGDSADEQATAWRAVDRFSLPGAHGTTVPVLPEISVDEPDEPFNDGCSATKWMAALQPVAGGGAVRGY